MSIPITQGSGQTSIASEKIGNIDFQQIEVYGGGGASVLSINPDGSLQASVIGVQTTRITGSVAVAIISGSIAATFTPPANQSVSGTVQIDVRGSVATVIIGGSIAASFIPPANQSVSGTVGASIIGLPPFVIGGSTNSSVIVVGASSAANQSVSGTVGASIIGQLPGGGATLGSVQTIQGGTRITSVVGNYAAGSNLIVSTPGNYNLGARNDTLASVLGADLTFAPITVGPVGEVITANSPITKWVQGTADFRQGNAGASILVMANGTTSIFQYATAIQVANMGSASVLVTLAAGGSTLGYTIAPAGGGSNIYYPNGLKTPASFGLAASLSGIASVLVSAQGFISKT